MWYGLRRLLAGVAAVIGVFAVLAMSAAACEGVGGPPSSPTGGEKKGTCNEADPNLKDLCTGDPVNNATGDLTEEQADLSIGGRGPGLHIVRVYDSSTAAEAKTAGPWGFGWTGPYDASLEVNSAAETA